MEANFCGHLNENLFFGLSDWRDTRCSGETVVCEVSQITLRFVTYCYTFNSWDVSRVV